MLAFAAARIMEFGREAIVAKNEGEGRTGSPMREGQRNRSRARVDGTPGRIPPEIAKRRKGSLFPSAPEPRRTAGKALMALDQSS